jgi:hypothetical protein
MTIASASCLTVFVRSGRALSSSPRGIAAQLSLTNARSLRVLKSWIARAMSSLPVPVSPRIITPESVGETTDTCSRTLIRPRLVPTIWPKLCSLHISSCR